MEAGFWFWITFEHGAHWDEKLITHPGLTSGFHSVGKNEGAEAHPNVLWAADLYKRLAVNHFGKASTVREFYYPSDSTIEFIWRPMDRGFRIAAPTFHCAVEIVYTGGRLIIRGSDHNPITQKILTLTDQARLFEDDYTVSFTGSFDPSAQRQQRWFQGLIDAFEEDFGWSAVLETLRKIP